MRRYTRDPRRRATAPFPYEAPAATTAAPAREPPQDTEDTPPGTEVQPTEYQPAVPAGAEPEDPSAPPQPSFRNRGRLRRRLRFLRRVRELGYRDLGGLVFDQYKFSRQNIELVRGKITALAAVDAELRALEEALGEKREITELREPGISACPRCGTLHGSDARYCPSCGLALSGARTIASDVGEGVHGGRPQPQPPASGRPARRARPAPRRHADRQRTRRDAGRRPRHELERPVGQRAPARRRARHGGPADRGRAARNLRARRAVSATAPPAEAGTTCPRCGAYVAEQQDWCLRCGDAARTRLVPTPNWRLPLMLAGVVAALALLVIAISFVQLTRNDAPVATTTTPRPRRPPRPRSRPRRPPRPRRRRRPAPGATTTAPGATTTAPGATATTPGATATTPGATTTAPGTTTTTPGATTTTP